MSSAALCNVILNDRLRSWIIQASKILAMRKNCRVETIIGAKTTHPLKLPNTCLRCSISCSQLNSSLCESTHPNIKYPRSREVRTWFFRVVFDWGYLLSLASNISDTTHILDHKQSGKTYLEWTARSREGGSCMARKWAEYICEILNRIGICHEWSRFQIIYAQKKRKSMDSSLKGIEGLKNPIPVMILLSTESFIWISKRGIRRLFSLFLSKRGNEYSAIFYSIREEIGFLRRNG